MRKEKVSIRLLAFIKYQNMLNYKLQLTSFVLGKKKKKKKSHETRKFSSAAEYNNDRHLQVSSVVSLHRSLKAECETLREVMAHTSTITARIKYIKNPVCKLQKG